MKPIRKNMFKPSQTAVNSNSKLFDSVKALFTVGERFEKTDNFYYQTHKCGQNKDIIKVQMNYILKSDSSDEIVRIGICPVCHTVFYHEDYENRL